MSRWTQVAILALLGVVAQIPRLPPPHHREFKTFHTKAQVFLADGQKLSAVAREFAPITEDPMFIDQRHAEKLLSAVSACRNQ